MSDQQEALPPVQGPQPNQQAINYHKKRRSHRKRIERKYVKNPNPGRYKYKYKYRSTAPSGRSYWVYLYYTPYKSYRANARKRLKRQKRKYKGYVKKYKDRWKNLKKVRKRTVDMLLAKLTPAQKTKLRRLLGAKKPEKKSKKPAKKSKKPAKKKPAKKTAAKKSKRGSNVNRKVKKSPQKNQNQKNK